MGGGQSPLIPEQGYQGWIWGRGCYFWVVQGLCDIGQSPWPAPLPVLPGFPLQPNGKGQGQGVEQALGIMTEPPLHCHPLTKPPQSDARASLQWELRPFPPLSCGSLSRSDFLVLPVVVTPCLDLPAHV